MNKKSKSKSKQNKTKPFVLFLLKNRCLATGNVQENKNNSKKKNHYDFVLLPVGKTFNGCEVEREERY